MKQNPTNKRANDYSPLRAHPYVAPLINLLTSLPNALDQIVYNSFPVRTLTLFLSKTSMA